MQFGQSLARKACLYSTWSLGRLDGVLKNGHSCVDSSSGLQACILFHMGLSRGCSALLPGWWLGYKSECPRRTNWTPAIRSTLRRSVLSTIGQCAPRFKGKKQRHHLSTRGMSGLRVRSTCRMGLRVTVSLGKAQLPHCGKEFGFHWTCDSSVWLADMRSPPEKIM